MGVQKLVVGAWWLAEYAAMACDSRLLHRDRDCSLTLYSLLFFYFSIFILIVNVYVSFTKL